MIKAVTAFEARDGRLFATVEEARNHEEHLFRLKKYERVTSFFSWANNSDRVSWYVIDHWDALKRLMEGSDAT